MNGIIFDFNGTMVQDSQYHAAAWVQYAAQYLGLEITREYYAEKIHGHANDYITGLLLRRTPTEKEILEVGDTKEEIYRRLCQHAREKFHLTKGLPCFLDTALENGVPMAIASSATKANMDFYLERFGLLKWFDKKKIVYDDGSFENKPSPDIYLRAINLLGLSPGNITVFEDSDSGIESAYRARVEKIIRISQNTLPDPRVNLTIRDFTQILL